MRSKLTRPGALLVVLALALPWTAQVGAIANHGGDATPWIGQAGDGYGNSTGIFQNFSLRTVLFNNTRYRRPNGNNRPEIPTKHLAWGTTEFIVDGVRLSQLSLLYSEDGIYWRGIGGERDRSPIGTYLRDPNGDLLPFLLDKEYADIEVFDNVNDMTVPLFVIYWSTADSAGMGASRTLVSSIHRAVSFDGIIWDQETPISQATDVEPQDPNSPVNAPGDQPVLDAGTWKAASNGPTDIIKNPAGSTGQRCGRFSTSPGSPGPLPPNPPSPTPPSVTNLPITSPWLCRWVMVYEGMTNPAGDARSIGMAGSPDGTIWYGFTNPVLAPSAGSWDEEVVTQGRIRRVGSSWQMLYSGGPNEADCSAPEGAAQCYEVGYATSLDGFTWTKMEGVPGVPAVRRALVEQFRPDDPSTLWFPQIIDDQKHHGANHGRVYYTRIDDKGFGELMLGYLNPAPGAGPQIRYAHPEDGMHFFEGDPVFVFEDKRDRVLTVYITDTLGTTEAKTKPNLATLVLTMDALPVGGIGITESIVTGLRYSSHKLEVPLAISSLPAGKHTVSTTVSDFDGNASVANLTFWVDDPDLNTAVSSAPTTRDLPACGYGLGTFIGTTTEGSGITGTAPGTELLRIHALVTNPLGFERDFFVPLSHLTKVGPGLDAKKKWKFEWVAPHLTLDAFFCAPGTYTVSMLGEDIARNVEAPSAANTRTVNVIL